MYTAGTPDSITESVVKPSKEGNTRLLEVICARHDAYSSTAPNNCSCLKYRIENCWSADGVPGGGGVMDSEMGPK